VTPEFDDDAEFDAWEGRFGGGELVVDVDARTISVELAYGMREGQEARFSVDLASAESLFARRDDDTDAEDVAGGGKGEWEVEWHAADRAIDLDDPAALGEIEHPMIAAGADPAAVREHIEPLEDLAAKVEEEREDAEDEFDPAAVLEVLDHTLVALRSAGVRRAVIGYTGRSAIADGWPHGVAEALAEGPLAAGRGRLGRAHRCGRAVSARSADARHDDPHCPARRLERDGSNEWSVRRSRRRRRQWDRDGDASLHDLAAAELRSRCARPGRPVLVRVPVPTIARMIPPHDVLVEQLAELIAIPSVSADPVHADDIRRAADWVVERIHAAGGEAEIQERGGRPLVIGHVAASTGAGAPTVLAYEHLDVLPPDPLDLWQSDPWALVERNGSLVARGVADDKAHLYMLLEATRLLAADGELPVNVRFAIDAEEEVGGRSVIDGVEEDGRPADVALVLDGGYATESLPSFCTALRGMCYFHVTVRTGERDLHSGLYGGAALAATHALMQMLAAVLPDRDGRLPEPLRAGIVAPTEEELAGWSVLPPGAEELASDGARPNDAAAAAEFRLRTTAEPSVTVNGIESGSPRLQKTVLPVEAVANVSMRLAPGQTVAAMAPVFERLLREAAPEGATVDVELWSTGEPGYVDPEAPAIVLAQDAFEHVLGVRPVLVRSGGSIPVVASLVARGVPAIVTGFARPTAQMHSPNEHIPAAALREGLETTVELLRRFGELG
jgi:acetylornithine deacetylase/succinyl-diaminopimelate desuccinylase-like protein